MAESTLNSLFDLWNKLSEVFYPSASSSRPLVAPELNKLSEMVYEVYSPLPKEKPELEVVFFHGLQLKPFAEAYFTTWMSGDDSHFWLKTWLVEEFPKARILTISYDSAAKSTEETGRLHMYCAGENLVSQLTSDFVRVGEVGCPIVLVGYCLGGLVLKEVCLSAGWTLGRNSLDMPGVQAIHDFFSNLRGMFFYATPHTGSLLGDKLHDSFNGPLLADMEHLKDTTARRNEEFHQLKLRHKWVTRGIGELQKTFVECLGKHIHVVTDASARPYMDEYYSAAANHYNICKPNEKNAITFQYLREFLDQIHRGGAIQDRVVGDAVSEEYVDLEGRAAQVESMMARSDANTIFIAGLSGIGKTALARKVFRNIAHTFSVQCFVHLKSSDPQSNDNGRDSENILRKVYDALKRLGKGWNYDHFSIPKYLQRKKVLMIVANVESQSQLDSLQMATWLDGSASRLIVTTANPRLGSKANTFVVPYLSDEESRLLFLHYAFDGEDGPNLLRKYTKQVIEKCGNFPLALKILGTFIKEEEDVHDQRLWLSLIDKLKKVEEVDGGREYRLWARLRPSFDALPKTEKAIFLDVATVFHGFPLKLLECIWQGRWGDSAYLAYKNLKRRFLIDEEEDGKIRMPGQVRTLGRSIACPWDSSVDKWQRVSSFTSARALIAEFQDGVQTQALTIEAPCNERLWLRNSTIGQYSQLFYLILDGVEMTGGSVRLPRSLVYLRWKNALFDACPVDFNGLQNFAVLDLRKCEAMKLLPPSLVAAKKLVWLELKGCLSLTELPSEFFEHRHLKYLGLSRTGLTKLPKGLGKLKELEQFHAGHTQLTRIPQAIGRLNMLLSLDISHTPVKFLPESIGDLKFLTSLYLEETLISFLPESIGQLKGLRKLNMAKSLLTCLPESLGDVSGLKELILDRTPLEVIPSWISKLRSLIGLHLTGCTRLRRLPDTFGELSNLECLSVRTLPETLNKLPQLSQVSVPVSTLLNNHRYVNSRTESASSVSHEQLGTVHDPELQYNTTDLIGGEDDARSPRGVQIETTMFPRLSYPLLLPSLEDLHLTDDIGCQQYQVSALFRVLQQLPGLFSLVFEDFSELETMPEEIGTLTGLSFLRICLSKKLCVLPESVGLLPELEEIHLSDLPRLRRLPESLGTFPIVLLEILDCRSLRSMPSSWGHRSPLGKECPTSPDSSLSSYHQSRSLPEWILTDSWSILRCLLECCGAQQSMMIYFKLKCGQMERLRKMAVEGEEGSLVISTKFIKELCSECCDGDDGVHEIFSPSTPWPCLGSSVDGTLMLECEVHDDSLCLVHERYERLVVHDDTGEKTDGDKTEEEESDSD